VVEIKEGSKTTLIFKVAPQVDYEEVMSAWDALQEAMPEVTILVVPEILIFDRAISVVK